MENYKLLKGFFLSRTGCPTPTNESNGLRKKLREILTPVIRDGNLFVLEFSIMLKHVGKVGSNIQDVLDAIFAQDIQVARIFGAAQIQIG